MATDLYEISGLCVDVEYMIMGVLANNVYIVSDGEGTMVVDPSCSADKILAALGERKLDAIVLTHSHFDHTGAAAELREVTAYFLQKANETAPLVERDADGVIAASDLSQLGKQAGAGYETLAKTMDCFDGSTARVKTLLSSKWFGKTGTTGIFIAFTGESSISSTTFTASVPFTMCHEIGHRMAFARENEANFAAFLACEASEDARFAYSGYYTAFLYCYNALRKVDAAAANEVWSGACDELRADCAAANSHYKKVEDQKVSQVTDKIYNSYLQTVGVESGRQSYGEVVDLLTAWYFTQEATQ